MIYLFDVYVGLIFIRPALFTMDEAIEIETGYPSLIHSRRSALKSRTLDKIQKEVKGLSFVGTIMDKQLLLEM